MSRDTSPASLAHYLKARARRSWKSKEVKRVSLQKGLEKARHVVVFVVRNEVHRLSYFLSYYRKLGIEHFICIDNGSSDGTTEYLAAEADVSVFSSTGSYKGARFGNDWVNELINRYCSQKWVLYVDADEFLVYPHCETAPIGTLTGFLDKLGEQSLRTVMVDMYSSRKIADNICEPGQDPLEICDLFDRSGYASHFDRRNQTIWIKGGVRGRVYFADRIWDGPALNKTPLVYMGGERMFLKSTHQVWPLSLNIGEVRSAVRISGALLHFKFMSTFIDRAAEQVRRAEHSSEYVRYQANAENEGFVGEATTRYSGWQDLSDNGLVQGEGWTRWTNFTDQEIIAAELA
ncbi:glycosyltransferase family 2 protein [Rhizobium halophytocola]|uniref:Glycosyltransferase involved in cell wall biosynthesis n=1 Tax=Rhizobium halophytocola TaxID=735519 RepID=A0ABS4E5I4_9HYPH|nr:glycosyltransferase family 2 protein [Rhizobium halophytocola]MBP1853187.1 glycosyltransferase involved in cell wall biosynthesis [Rhizobium halophytocola]